MVQVHRGQSALALALVLVRLRCPLAGGTRGDETLGVPPAEPGTFTGAVSPKVRLVSGSADTLDCCYEHVSQSLERCDPLGGTSCIERGEMVDGRDR